jgi:hypothetical protein
MSSTKRRKQNLDVIKEHNALIAYGPTLIRTAKAIAAELSLTLLADRPDGSLGRDQRERAAELVRELKALVRLVDSPFDPPEGNGL